MDLKIGVAALCGLAAGGRWAAAAPLEPGSAAPDFTAKDGEGREFRLSEHAGKRPVVLFFYPKDGTPGCTREVCSVRDAFPELRRLDVAVAGLSYDSVKSHARFAAKHALPFPLLSDPDGAIAKAYGAYRRLFARRMTFIVGADGRIVYVDPAVEPEGHGAALVKVLAGLAPASPRAVPAGLKAGP
ncbi:MAG: peroxiredoxin [Elusimicrobia bacterium]|nr:peroxiredoxin [Elusimicrobiota bacterium]